MDFAFDARTEELRARLLAFMDEHVYPAEEVAHEQRQRLSSPWENPPVVEELKEEARRQGLWNLFLPDAEYGAGLTNLQYAPLAEITGRSPQLAPTATNCAAPDTGNMEVLAQFGDERQKKQWLEPLLAGEIRSAFAMTEPDVASSDATNITTHIRREGDEYVITGRKWYISGAMHPDCTIFIVMGKTDPDGPDIRRQQSMVLVPRDTRASRSSGPCRSSATRTTTTAATPRWSSTRHGCRCRTSSVRRAAGSPSPRHGSVRAGSTTACG
ncbi:acyl-CoA dehydrogenase family protein [Streptomyces thermocarboxydus]